MSPDTQVRERPDTAGTDARPRATIKLRGDRLDVMTSVLGAGTDPARGRLIGVHAKTIKRARAGIIGEELIAQTLASLAEYADQLAAYNLAPTFDELFVVEAGPR